MAHYELSRLPPGPSKYEEAVRRREGGAIEKYPPLRGPPTLPEPSTFLADLEKSTQTFFSQQRATLSLSSQYELEEAGKNNAVLKSFHGHSGQSRHGQGLGIVVGTGMGQVATLGMGPDTMLIYDEFLQQHRRPVSKLDLEEKRRREAKEKGMRCILAALDNMRSYMLLAAPFLMRGFKKRGVSSNLIVWTGYYYELDDSYDESDEEEVRAHLRRVAEQPPLKLDESTEVKHLPTHAFCAFLIGPDKILHSHNIFFCLAAQKLNFFGVFGLTTMGRRDELVQQKRRKRRRMLRERSPSPPVSHSKRTPPPPQLSTRFTPEEMDRAPELEDKKRFLTMFRLSHVTVQQRRGENV